MICYAAFLSLKNGIQVCKDRVRALQNKMSARNERIKLILQRGAPDSEPLDT